ncbi:peptide chain release factor N(5)-glutamine methyltransferase [Beijerinckia mobilis]|uniref:peptide chain release factor N(5)-glutamine methyltransferase n=1 Tax=Beijerinckia mobilis TaxID=231434 RepID=UPI001FD8A895|nr:peptide chain release factor N(5)-glutamine methyltransferase [Beijerinckia mobilis]
MERGAYTGASFPANTPGFEGAALWRRDVAQRHLTNLFTQAGLATPGLDARLLLCGALGIDHAALVRDPDRLLGTDAGRLAEFCLRRLAYEPVSRILGHREFWSLDFQISPAVLDPRADTETLIETVLKDVAASGQRPTTILDFGTGSGAILAAFLKEWPEAFGIGIDLSPMACVIASDNLTRLGFGSRSVVVCGDWGSALKGRFDLIVSNPPYIPREEIGTLDLEVRLHDPHLALDGGGIGFAAYQALLPMLPALLAQNGLIALECGAGQMPELRNLLRQTGFTPGTVGVDLGGHERVVLARPLGSTN